MGQSTQSQMDQISAAKLGDFENGDRRPSKPFNERGSGHQRTPGLSIDVFNLGLPSLTILNWFRKYNDIFEDIWCSLDLTFFTPCLGLFGISGSMDWWSAIGRKAYALGYIMSFHQPLSAFEDWSPISSVWRILIGDSAKVFFTTQSLGAWFCVIGIMLDGRHQLKFIRGMELFSFMGRRCVRLVFPWNQLSLRSHLVTTQYQLYELTRLQFHSLTHPRGLP